MVLLTTVCPLLFFGNRNMSTNSTHRGTEQGKIRRPEGAKKQLCSKAGVELFGRHCSWQG
jgi:hypothetical protein